MAHSVFPHWPQQSQPGFDTVASVPFKCGTVCAGCGMSFEVVADSMAGAEGAARDWLVAHAKRCDTQVSAAARPVPPDRQWSDFVVRPQ